MYEETTWVKGLRVLAWIIAVVGVIGGFSTAWSAARTVTPWETEFSFSTFLLILVVSLVGTFLLTASIMVLLDIAADISITRQINYDMLRVLQQNKVASSAGTAKSIECSSCNRTYDTSYNSCPHCGYRPSGIKPTLSSIAAKSSSSDDYWRCSHCSDKNPLSARNCRGCGKDK